MVLLVTDVINYLFISISQLFNTRLSPWEGNSSILTMQIACSSDVPPLPPPTRPSSHKFGWAN